MEPAVKAVVKRREERAQALEARRWRKDAREARKAAKVAVRELAAQRRHLRQLVVVEASKQRGVVMGRLIHEAHERRRERLRLKRQPISST
jgi:hypothetical protein